MENNINNWLPTRLRDEEVIEKKIDIDSDLSKEINEVFQMIEKLQKTAKGSLVEKKIKSIYNNYLKFIQSIN